MLEAVSVYKAPNLNDVATEPPGLEAAASKLSSQGIRLLTVLFDVDR